MAQLIQDDGNLCVDAERVDLSQLCTETNIDTDTLCVTGLIDTDNLCTDIGDTLAPQRYRADTTLITADNTSITADYAY